MTLELINTTSLFLVFASIFLWVFATLPAFGLSAARRARLDYVLDVLPKATIEGYCRMWIQSTVGDGTAAPAAFKQKYAASYGRRRHFWMIAYAALNFLVVVSLGTTIAAWLKRPSSLQLPPIVASALIGGMMWCIWDQLVRLRNRDFSEGDVANYVYRIVLSAPLGLALSSLVKEDLAVPLAFGLGAFPTTTLLKYGRRAVDRRLNLGDSAAADAAHLSLEALQGIDRPQAERFADEGIRGVLQLAYSDPIDLTIRTNFDLDYVTDCISQALLWTYTTKKLEDVQRLGMRGAVEVRNLLDQVEDPKQKLQPEANENFAEIAKTLDVTPGTLARIVREIVSDLYAMSFASFGTRDYGRSMAIRRNPWRLGRRQRPDSTFWLHGKAPSVIECGTVDAERWNADNTRTTREQHSACVHGLRSRWLRLRVLGGSRNHPARESDNRT